jgi:hypothetical protein
LLAGQSVMKALRISKADPCSRLYRRFCRIHRIRSIRGGQNSPAVTRAAQQPLFHVGVQL